jgi:hypothetical protein
LLFLILIPRKGLTWAFQGDILWNSIATELELFTVPSWLSISRCVKQAAAVSHQVHMGSFGRSSLQRWKMCLSVYWFLHCSMR